MARAAPRLAPVPGLTDGGLEMGRTTIVWSASPNAPVSSVSSGDTGAVVWGDALEDGIGVRATAAGVARAWSNEQAPPQVFDGFYAAAVVAGDDVVLGADIFGLFPVYYAALGDVLLAGSTPEGFRHHPLFREAISAEGLFGLLLAGGPLAGRCLMEGVVRLGAGALLRWRPGAGAREVPHYVFPEAGRLGPLGFDEQVDLLAAAMDVAVRRHVRPHGMAPLLLSGGRDSRLLGGYMSRHGTLSEALTLGKRTDYDAMCAAGVARALHVPQRTGEIQYDDFPAYADRVVTWEHLSGGMSSMHTWGTWDALGSTDGALMNGYLFELRGYALLPPAREEMLAWSYKRATSPEVLRSFVRTESLRELVDDVAGVIRNRFDSICNDPAERSWRWRTATYKRFHAGAVPWRLSFGAWPVMPILDRALLETMLALPRDTMASRQLADGVMRRDFPALARLPLDRNAHDVTPLVSSLGWRIRQALGRRLPALAPSILRRAGDTERRYYVRLYDFDNDGWRAVRTAAERGRDQLGEWFDPGELAKIVPGPDRAAGHSDTVLQGYLPKMLVGFMRRCALREAEAA